MKLLQLNRATDKVQINLVKKLFFFLVTPKIAFLVTARAFRHKPCNLYFFLKLFDIIYETPVILCQLKDNGLWQLGETTRAAFNRPYA